MSEDLDNIINNCNEQITNTAYTKETTSKSIFEELKPRSTDHYTDLIEFVSDRQGHDFRYALNNKKIKIYY